MKLKPTDSHDGIDLDHVKIQTDMEYFHKFYTTLPIQERLHAYIKHLQGRITTGLNLANLPGFETYPRFNQLKAIATTGILPFTKQDFIPNRGHGDFSRTSQYYRLHNTITQHIRKLQDNNRCWVVPLCDLQGVPGFHLSALHVASKAGDSKGRACTDATHSGLNAGTDMDAITHYLGDFKLPQLRALARMLSTAEKQGNTQLHKTDVSSAFNNMLLSPEAAMLQTFLVGDQVIIPLVAGFGWCAAPAFYNVIAEALSWAHNGGIADDILNKWTVEQGRDPSPRNLTKTHRSITYVDDSCGQSSTVTATGDMGDFQTLITQLLGPRAYNRQKTEGPAELITIIGWACNAPLSTIQPGAKGHAKLYYWIFRGLQETSLLSLHDMQSAVGTLRWYSAVVPLASTFELQKILTIGQRRSTSAKTTNQRIFCKLTPAAIRELDWWKWLLATNLTKPMLETPAWYLARDPGHRPHKHVFSDAAGNIGGGYVIPDTTYGQFLWSHEEKTLYGRGDRTDINGLEFVVAICAIIANRDQLKGTVVHLHVDNTSAVAWLNKRRTSQLFGQAWIRLLISVMLTHDILVECHHIPAPRYRDLDRVIAAKADAVGNITPEDLVHVYHTALTGGVCPHTQSARSTGLRAFERVWQQCHWPPPYITGTDDIVDLSRILIALDILGHQEGLSRGTVADYFTSTKHHYTVERQFVDSVSRVWGTKGQHHPLVTMMLKSIPVKHRPPHQLLSPEWIKDGFEHCWTTTEYVAIAFIFGWVLRPGEACDTHYAHIITWAMVTFSVFNQVTDTWHPLPWTRLRDTPCDLVDLRPQSRKYQPEPRRMPGRVNTCYLENPALGITTWCHLNMPTLLQAWAIANSVDLMTDTERARRPLLASPGTNWTISRDEVSNALRRLAQQRNEAPSSVTPHSLRTASMTKLANSHFAENTDMYLRAVGHHSLASSEPYITPDVATATDATTAMESTTPVYQPR